MPEHSDTKTTDAAISDEAFSSLMVPLGPFERHIHVAVGCSGGADSLALTLLLSNWARQRGGQVTALIVDHGLRDESADEASLVQRWLEDRHIDCRVLRAALPPQVRSLQESARNARYELMADWCARHGVLHLLLAHHREDQAETVLLNLTRGSGVDGLAGMSAIAERPSHRLLRPLLSIPKARLERTLSLQGQDFIKDASNSNAKFKRVRIRQALPALAKEGASVARLVKTADRMAQARAALEGAATCLLASSAAVYPEGYARVEIDPLLRAPSEVVLRALARLVTCIGGKAYPPRLDRLQRCYQNLLETGGGGFARTLGGCRIIARAAALYICREIPRAATSKKLSPYALWDGRFFLWAGTMCDTDVRPLSAKSAPFLRGHKIARVPAAVRYSLPSVLGLDGTLRLPHFKGVCIQDCADNSEAIHAVFQPLRPLSSAPFWNGSGMNRP